MTLTPEKLDEIERLANAAAEVLCYRVGEVRDYVLYESVLRDLDRELDPATVRELVRAAREGMHQIEFQRQKDALAYEPSRDELSGDEA